MNLPVKLLLLTLLAIACGTTAAGRKIKLRLKPPVPTETSIAQDIIEVTADSVASAPYSLRMISFSGYDKEAQAAVESFFITNHTDRILRSITLTIHYRTLDNRRLHSRQVTIELNIAPGATERADIKTWDRQHTFYYHRGNRPRKKATPYEVAFHVETFRLVL